MFTQRATPLILAVILAALSGSPISSAKAVEVCALSHGTDGTQVLIPDPHSSIPQSAICSSAKAVEACTVSHGTFNGSHELLIPHRQPSIPSDVLKTKHASAAADRAPLDVVGFDGEDHDPCGDGGDHQATAAGICRNDCVAVLLCPAVTTLVTLLNFQPRGDSSLLDSWSPSGSTSSPPPPPPPTSSLPPSASFPIIMVQLAIVIFGFTVNLIGWLMFRRGRVEIVFGFTFSLIGWMMLRRGRVTATNFCRCARFFLVAVAFFSMTYRFVPDHLAWAAQAAATVLALVLAYSLGERL
ncbi:hypothetical protein RHMOL_Rhmol06G0261900 [Rhododendron molle]|uniref:Uncharacterized protein n=1 Tax=Rhododendron molle TaxID=49168 RepID=A0ACC0NG81_RHOML|nr:hypothetical protein RHMOL_Rhmol06G0261900 [Rhododendron molle]